MDFFIFGNAHTGPLWIFPLSWYREGGVWWTGRRATFSTG